MGRESQLLEIHPRGRSTVAVLPHAAFDGQEMADALRQDLRRLARELSGPVVLDLRQVQSFGDCLFPPILEFCKALRTRATGLIICGGKGFQDIVRITRLDQLFEVVERIDPESERDSA